MVVEFALIVPMLLLLVFGIMEFGFMMNRDTAIDNAARDGARVASLDGTYADIRASIADELTGSGIPVNTVTGTDANKAFITINCKKSDGTACNATSTTYDTLAESGTTAVIKVTYSYKWITPLVSSLFGSSATLEQSTQMRVE